MQHVRVATIAGLAAAGVLATAGAAGAAPHATGSAPSVAKSTQTIFFQAKKSGGYKGSESIIFAKKAFTVPTFQDKGTFTNTGGTLDFTVQKSQQGDGHCMFTATYDTATTYYTGTYTCPGGFMSTFAVTTAGS